MNSQKARKVLVSDFDGTMTQHDFYQLAIERLISPNEPDHWTDYRAGRITHFEGLRRYFAAIRGTEQDVIAILARMQLDPDLARSVRKLQLAGWEVVVASAGCEWYIRRLLSQAGVSVEVHANPGRFEPGEGLLMERPVDSPFPSDLLGIDKSAIVQHFLSEGATVAFAGDGYPDIQPAQLVSPDLRFARRDLAAVLQGQGLSFTHFEVWSEIADSLLSSGH